MGNLVSVRVSDKTKVSFLVGKREYTKGDEGKKCDFGLSLFVNGKYILNFVLLDDELELLASDSSIKSVKDIGYMLIANHGSLVVLKHMGKSNTGDFYSRLDDNEEDIYAQSCSYEQLTAHKGDYAFPRALKVAMENVHKGANLYSSIPEGIGEIWVE